MPKTKKVKKDQGYRTWKSRTCPVCKKRFQTTQWMLTHQEADHRPPNPAPQEPITNQIATLQYSQDKHISDLRNQNRKILDVASDVIHMLLDRL